MAALIKFFEKQGSALASVSEIYSCIVKLEKTFPFRQKNGQLFSKTKLWQNLVF